MREFEMKFNWYDRDEACYRGTKIHEQKGGLKTWKLDHETDEQYQERTRNLINKKHMLLFDEIKQIGGGSLANITSIRFR